MNNNLKIKQHDITDCGAACIASICRFYGLSLPIAKIRQYAYTDRKGTNILGLEEAFSKLNMTANGVKAETPEALDEVPLPVIAHVIVRGVLAHYVVIYKVSKNHVTYMDPADGEFHKETKEEFCKIWTRILVLVDVTEKFIGGKQTTGTWSRLLRYVKPHRKMLVEALFGAAITTILGLSMSIYVGKITDYVLPNGNLNLLHLMGVMMISILVIQTFVGFIRDLILLNTGQRIDSSLILGYYQHVLHLPKRFFDSMSIGEITSRISDAAKIRQFINSTVLGLILNSFTVIVAFTMMLFFSWKLTMLILLALPFLGINFFIFNKLNKKYKRKIMESSSDLQTQLVESINNVQTVKCFGLENYSNIKTETRYVKLLRNIYTASMGSMIINGINSFISSAETIAVLWYGSTLALGNDLTPGGLMMFYTLLGYVISPIVSLISSNSEIQDAFIAADRLFQIMDLDTETAQTATIDLTKDIVGDIHFQNVTFRYGTRKDVFSDLNLTISKGKTTAIVGRSGSGKTTLISLLQNLYSVQDGKVTIGDYDVTMINHRSLRRCVSAVPQSIELFSGTLLENIAIGDFEPDMQLVTDLIRRLGLEQFVAGLPKGINTQVGEHGTALSGGERQRVAIARSLYKRPEILILDEATSSLDSVSEKYVKQALEYVASQGITVIIIAHRLTTVKTADEIIVLKEGQVVEKGTHPELIEKQGEYFELWKEQIFD